MGEECCECVSAQKFASSVVGVAGSCELHDMGAGH